MKKIREVYERFNHFDKMFCDPSFGVGGHGDNEDEDNPIYIALHEMWMAIKADLERDEKNKKYFMAWCSYCFDALEAIKVLNEKGIIVDYKYYCIGCDKTFRLLEEPINL